MSHLPIADYALLSDCHSAALVSSAGSVDWLCFPHFDSQSVFGRLLDYAAGHWSICARGAANTSRRYLDATMVLETTFKTDAGTALLTDAMALGSREREHDLGRNAPHCLLRSLSCTHGQIEIDFEYAPRPEYGLVIPLLKPVEKGVLGRGGASVLLLSSPIALKVEDGTVRTTFILNQGETVHFALQHRLSWEDPPSVWTQEEISRRLTDTAEGWRSWSHIHQNYDGPWRDLVAHSGRVLQALTFYPTGAIVAAPTTSLPETIGGDRNWDYRFTWVRDACFTLEALWVAACPDEAHKFFDFLAGAALTQVSRGNDLQIMFGIGGEHDLTERTLPHLSGWRSSRPVRVGNGAWNQRQLDVYGELMGAVYLLTDQLKDIDQPTRDFLVSAVDTAASRWEQKDQGIWEIRGEPRDFLYSKLMCWVALDRAIRLVDLLKTPDRISYWQQVRDKIRTVILEHGWSEEAGAFTQAFGSDDLDASNLMMPIVGFLPANDPRMLSTINAIATRLTDQHGLVYRYRAQDGMTGEEGSFLLCTFWLAQALALAGKVEQAKETFARAIAFANDVGLLAEEVNPATRELLGNFPQAFSHIGLVNAAWAISQADKLGHKE